MPLGKRIRYYRKEAGLTQYDLADAVGITQPLLSMIERGLTESSISTVRSIWQALVEAGATCTIGQLLGVEPIDTPEKMTPLARPV